MIELKEKMLNSMFSIFFIFILMKNKKLEALYYFLLGIILSGLAYFLFEEFKPVGNVAEYTVLNELSWLGHRIGKMPIVIIVALLSLIYFYKSIRLLRNK
jgi:hypothetical protein